MGEDVVYKTDELRGRGVEQLIVSNLRFTIPPRMLQLRSQGLSSYRLLAPGGGKMRDPGNEVENDSAAYSITHEFYGWQEKESNDC